MRADEELAQAARRLEELAARTDAVGKPCFSGFLSPPEAELAKAAGRKAGVFVRLEGGYEEAERRMACFLPDDGWEPSFPIAALKLRWPHQSAPSHRDILGSVMGLGLKRQCVGDIVVMEEWACLFAETVISEHIAQSLTSAGRVKLQSEILDAWPLLETPQGVELRDTVSSLRLDAAVSAGFGMSRAGAAELISSGRVKLCHLPSDRPDARIKQGDVISARGLGRLVIEEIGGPTKKGRLPVKMVRYGTRR